MLSQIKSIQGALFAGAAGVMTLTACGGDHADLVAARVASHDGAGSESFGSDDDVFERLYNRVTWIFQCQNSPMPVPTPGPNELVLVDAGPHNFSREKLVSVPFTVKGKLCPAERLNRDAIFVVDVSGSMSTEDPQVPVDPAVPTGPKTCGRYEAYKAIMASMPPTIANFGVITFESYVRRSSTRLFATQAELESDISQNGTVPLLDIFCENPGGTSFAPALQRAKELFSTSRQYATKEIYFLTDGAPTDTAQSEQKATELKTVGVPINGQNKLVTIATVMLGSVSPDFLRDRIASKDVAGAPIHANAANASDLARLLDGMTDNQLVGSHILHGGNASPTPTNIDLMPILNPTTLEFQLPPMNIGIDLVQSEYQMKFEYWDSHLNYSTIVGRLAWTDR